MKEVVSSYIDKFKNRAIKCKKAAEPCTQPRRKLLKDPNFFELGGNIRFNEVSFPCFFSILVS